MSTTTAPWNILNVEITDALTGETLADVDASSTADAMAYFLDSRHLVPGATPAGLDPQGEFRGRQTMVTEIRTLGILERAFTARVH